VADLFRKNGIPVIDADKNVKSIYQKPKTIQFIKENFPTALNDGVINFKKIREIVFINPDAKDLLEKYIYAQMPEEFKKAFLEFTNPTFVIYDVPLLFEKQLHLMVDLSICVYAPRETQITRLMARDHSTRELAESILANQIDIEEKKKLADLVLTNTQDLNFLTAQFDKLLADIT
jgi:dephospho-CoA kinase